MDYYHEGDYIDLDGDGSSITNISRANVETRVNDEILAIQEKTPAGQDRIHVIGYLREYRYKEHRAFAISSIDIIPTPERPAIEAMVREHFKERFGALHHLLKESFNFTTFADYDNIPVVFYEGEIT